MHRKTANEGGRKFFFLTDKSGSSAHWTLQPKNTFSLERPEYPDHYIPQSVMYSLPGAKIHIPTYELMIPRHCVAAAKNSKKQWLPVFVY